MNNIKRIAVVVAVVMATMFSASPVQASTFLDKVEHGERIYNDKIVPANNPDRAYGRLTDPQQGAVRAYIKVRSNTVKASSGTTLCHPGRPCPQSVPTVYPPGCHSSWLTVTGRNALDMVIYTYSESISFCWDGFLITNYTYRDRLITTNMLFVSFEAHVADELSGGVGQTFFHAPTQGRFNVCIAFQGFGCFITYYPWIILNAYGTGEVTAEWGQ